jgi:prepilin-type processing-associated H-X9-DG protein
MTNYRRNWVIHLFPFMEQQALYDSVNWRQLVGVSGGLTNYAAGVVTYNAFTSVAIPSLLCPSDIHNDTMWSVDRSGASIYAPPPPPSAYQTYGRLNYGAISCLMPPFNYYSSTNPNGLGYNDPCGGPTMEAWTPVIPHSWMTRGVMGWGTSLGIRQITDGASTTVAVWEIRAGLNSADFRGSWADGRPAGSTLWFHLLGPNVCYPANVWLAGDDIAGEWLSVSTALGATWQAIETQECMVMTSSSSGPASGMPRSTHPSGENALFCDGSVRWVSDLVDRGQVVNWYGHFTNPWGGNPARMGTWERLNASGDGLPIEEDRLDP